MTDELRAELDKLRRRLQRERAARLEAEAIAERGLRELYDKGLLELQQQQRQLQLLDGIAVAASQSSSVRDALEFTLEAICRFTGWPLSHAYVLKGADPNAPMRGADSIWYSTEGARFAEFCRFSDAIRFEPGLGLPARVLQDKSATWVADMGADPSLQRGECARRLGLKTAFAFPILLDSEVVAILEFFADHEIPSNHGLLQLTAQIDTHIGHVVQRKRVEEQLRHKAAHDALTGLPNRSQFMDMLARAIASLARDPDKSFAVLFVDLDRFKIVNDSLGHEAGDRLLVQVGSRLKAVMRCEDMVEKAHQDSFSCCRVAARLGGDEFTVLVHDVLDTVAALRVAERIHECLKAPFTVDGQDLYVSASIGIVWSGSSAANAGEVLRNADIALYSAKTQGRACSEVYDQALHERAVRRLKLETDLRQAVQSQQFELHYQPLVCLATTRISGFEALVRWRQADGALAAPSEFIQVAEETGLILPLGSWILHEACRALREWNTQFAPAQPFTMSVNISARQFVQEDLVAQVKGAVEEAHIEPHCLRLEITESVAMSDARQSARVMAQLRALGVRISIDDFGTGYSSLSYLHRFPLDVLKIDRSFVSQLDRRSESLKLVQTIVSLARQLDLEVVAEGAETAAQVACLKSLGCDFAQGYFFCKPIEAAAVARLLAEEHEAPGTHLNWATPV